MTVCFVISYQPTLGSAIADYIFLNPWNITKTAFLKLLIDNWK